MRITQAIAAKPVALRSKVLSILIILSLLGQAAPVLAREPVSVASNTPGAQQPAAGRTPDESWLVTWEASVEANASGDGVYVVRQSHANASAV